MSKGLIGKFIRAENKATRHKKARWANYDKLFKK